MNNQQIKLFFLETQIKLEEEVNYEYMFVKIVPEAQYFLFFIFRTKTDFIN